MSDPRFVVALTRSRSLRRVLLAALVAALLLPVALASIIAGVLSGGEEALCLPGGAGLGAGAGALGRGLFAQPLHMRAGRAYEVGASEYGGPGDPSSGDYGSIPEPSESYLPAHPDTFAELSLLQSNPANGGGFRFADADALAQLPYMSALRVSHDGHSMLVFKRDIGYGQGPGQSIENGQPYRLDLWWQAARALSVTKSPVTISLAPETGAAATLQALPQSVPEVPEAPGALCETGPLSESVPLPLAPGVRTRILPSGLAAAGEQTPLPVKQMVAAGNRLYGSAYLYGGGHGSSLNTLQSAYDCSSAVSYLLHWGGVLGPDALDSTGLVGYGRPGPGRYVTIYANASHAFIYVAGLRFDTVEDPAYDTGPNAGRPGARWRVSQTVPGWASWTVRHPPGL